MKTNNREYSFPKEQLFIKDNLSKDKSYKFEDFLALTKKEYPNVKGSDVNKWLKNLELDGDVLRIVNDEGISFRTTKYLEEVIGKVEWQPKGHAVLFVLDENQKKTGETLFLNRNEASLVINGEIAKVKRIPKEWRGFTSGGDDEGMVVDVISSTPHYTVGQNMGGGRTGWLSSVKLLEPMMKDVVRLSEKHQEKLPKEETEKVEQEGSFVAGYLRRTGRFERWCGLRAFFDVEEYVGKLDDVGIETKLGLKWMQAKEEFSVSSLVEADEVSSISIKQILKDEGRKDLRKIPFVTIDGESTKDFDDAISTVMNTDGSFKIFIAIADVSRYVRPGSALDLQAKERSTTLYMPHKAVPMLPEVLSTGVCSLNPGQENAVMVCEADISKEGSVLATDFYPAVITSHARLTYNDVDAYVSQSGLKLDNLLPMPEKEHAIIGGWSKDVTLAVRNSLEIANILRGQSSSKPFDREPEIVIQLDKKGKVEKLNVRNEATPANKLVEEFMLFANKEAANILNKSKTVSALFRNQSPPLEEDARPRGAKYENVSKGHYSLGHESYMHFTSPIRRYPDLMAHRAIKNVLGYTNISLPSGPEVEATGEYCNEKQRLARGASEKADQWLILQYAEKFKHEDESVKVLRETDRGWFVQGDNTNIQAFVLKPRHEAEVEKVLEAGIKVEVDRIDFHGEKIFLRLKTPEPTYENKESIKIAM